MYWSWVGAYVERNHTRFGGGLVPAIALILAGLIGPLVYAGGPPAKTSSLPDGANEYRKQCAVCHGVDGRGNGPIADQLRRRPTDLTRLSAKNGGSFPETLVYQSIDGRRVVLLHGPSDMPVWGERFRRSGIESVVDARISALVHFVESLQTQQ
jgi:mono/diheme cytochrome c family protein